MIDTDGKSSEGRSGRRKSTFQPARSLAAVLLTGQGKSYFARDHRFRQLLLALSAGILPLTAFAQSVPLTQDTYVVTGTPTNYGVAAGLQVGGAGNDQSLVQFDITTLPVGVTAANVAKATLVLFTRTVTTGGTVNIYAANGPWTETTGCRPLVSPLVMVAAAPLREQNSRCGGHNGVTITTGCRADSTADLLPVRHHCTNSGAERRQLRPNCKSSVFEKPDRLTVQKGQPLVLR